ncbi:MAG: AMP-binding protein, partial [Spirochaetales bacterium]|nr:AMP-binding protein [Candidatus Physcosoma equi]
MDYSFEALSRTVREDGLHPRCLAKYTFRDLLDAVAYRYKDDVAYTIFRGENADITYTELRRRAYAIGTALLGLGFQSGDKVAILGEGCPNWMVMYYGLSSVGIIAVPILPDFSEKDVCHILDDAGVKGICVNSKQRKKVSSYIEEKGLVAFRMDDLVAEGETSVDLTSTTVDEALLDAHQPKEEDIASIIYTSGTTGSSKGVVLSHRNILFNADTCTTPFVEVNEHDVVLSILPMSHVYEFTIGNVLPLMCGCRIVCLCKPPAVSFLLPALAETRPHIIMTVPLLIEKVYKAKVLPLLRKKPFAFAMKTPLLKSILRRVFLKELMNAFGGRVKFFGIGGAALDKEVEKFLHEIHFPYAIGYGLTETAPLISGCGPFYDKQLLGHIGILVPGLDVKLLEKNQDGIGEIAVKGPSVMMGYYNNEELNKEVFTEDGYFRTGDLGSFSLDGRLAIRGRSKTMILGSGGENIYPENIEGLINNEEFVEESLVVARGGQLVALVKLDLEAMAKKLSLDKAAVEEEAQKYLGALRNKVNKDLAVFSRIGEVVHQKVLFERT